MFLSPRVMLTRDLCLFADRDSVVSPERRQSGGHSVRGSQEAGPGALPPTDPYWSEWDRHTSALLWLLARQQPAFFQVHIFCTPSISKIYFVLRRLNILDHVFIPSPSAHGGTGQETRSKYHYVDIVCADISFQ